MLTLAIFICVGNTHNKFVQLSDCYIITLVNKRNDVAITKLNEFIMRVTYTDKNGERKQFLGRPVKFPLCKIPARRSRKLNLNFGKFADESVGNWVTAQTYTFTYINGARF